MLGKPVDFKSADGGTTYTINDRYTTNVDLQTSPYYYISLDSVDGLWGSDISYESHPIPNAIGEKSGDVFRRGKTITLTGKIYGRNLHNLYDGCEYLQHMFAETAIRKLQFTRWNDSFQIYINCRVSQDLVIVETLDGGKYVFSYTVGLRADDPRSYKVSDNSLYPTWQA